MTILTYPQHILKHWASHIRMFIIAATAMPLAVSCYSDISLDDYRDDEGSQLLVINAMVNPDSTICAMATRPYFFSDLHKGRTYVPDLDMHLYVGGRDMGTMTYDAAQHRYTSDIKPQPGDEVRIETHFNGREVSCTDTVPRPVRMERIEAECQGPLTIYWSNDYIYTYRITFNDPAGEDNYYFLSWKDKWVSYDETPSLDIGERKYSDEFVFQQLALSIHDVMPGWEPYLPAGLPFSDKGIDGTEHTLLLREIIQSSGGNRLEYCPEMWREFNLYTISKAYYDYLVGVICSRTDLDDNLLGNGLVDIGAAEPVAIPSNVIGGTGILGCYTRHKIMTDVKYAYDRLKGNEGK